MPTISSAASKPPARLEDVARLAGVAKSTVSRVLIGEKTLSIRAETRERVLAAARTLDYRPDMRARSLRTRRAFLLGIVMPDTDDPVFLSVLRGAQQAAAERHYALLVACAGRQASSVELHRRLVSDNLVGGVLVAAVDALPADPAPMLSDVQVVLVNGAPRPGAHVVAVDTDAGAQMALRHLAALGHRCVGFATAPAPDRAAGEHPLQGSVDLPALGLARTPVVCCGPDRRDAEAAIRHLLMHARHPPTALCTADAAIAAAAIGAARQLGLGVPEDLSVIALRDSPIAALLTPPVTAVAYPAMELGRLAAMDLIDIIEGAVAPSVPRMLPPSGLVGRGSVAAVA